MPAAARRSTSPATSGSSGPTTTSDTSSVACQGNDRRRDRWLRRRRCGTWPPSRSPRCPAPRAPRRPRASEPASTRVRVRGLRHRTTRTRSPIGQSPQTWANCSLRRQLQLHEALRLERVDAREAGVAVAVVGLQSPHHGIDREEGERVGADVLADLLDALLCGDQLLARRHVDAHVAGVGDRRAGDPHVDLGRAGVAQHLHEWARGGAAHDRVVDHHDPLAEEVVAERVELHRHAGIAQLLRRLDEGPPDVAVLDQALGVGDPGFLGVPDRVGGARVGHRHDEVGLDRRLAGQLAAESLAGRVHEVARRGRESGREK